MLLILIMFMCFPPEDKRPSRCFSRQSSASSLGQAQGHRPRELKTLADRCPSATYFSDTYREIPEINIANSIH
jgi:hypothetical protein